MRQPLQFDAVFAEVEEELLPNRLCRDLFELRQVFNRFYDQVPVLKDDGPARRSRLALCRLSADTLKLRLGLLGIPSLERMGGGVGNSGCAFLAIRLEFCLIHAHGCRVGSPLLGQRSRSEAGKDFGLATTLRSRLLHLFVGKSPN